MLSELYHKKRIYHLNFIIFYFLSLTPMPYSPSCSKGAVCLLITSTHIDFLLLMTSALCLTLEVSYPKSAHRGSSNLRFTCAFWVSWSDGFGYLSGCAIKYD